MAKRAVAKKGKDTDGCSDPWPLALRLLTRCDRSAAELRRKLLERGFAAEDVERTLERCLELGYLDDARYAARRAAGLMNQGRAVGHRILADLRQHGISEEIAGQALETARAEHDEDQVLESLVERRFPGFDYSTAPEREKRRIVHFLQRRGFPLGRIMDRLTRKGLQERDDDRQ